MVHEAYIKHIYLSIYLSIYLLSIYLSKGQTDKKVGEQTENIVDFEEKQTQFSWRHRIFGRHFGEVVQVQK
jgi:hypothetical protein